MAAMTDIYLAIRLVKRTEKYLVQMIFRHLLGREDGSDDGGVLGHVLLRKGDEEILGVALGKDDLGILGSSLDMKFNSSLRMLSSTFLSR